MIQEYGVFLICMLVRAAFVSNSTGVRYGKKLSTSSHMENFAYLMLNHLKMS